MKKNNLALTMGSTSVRLFTACGFELYLAQKVADRMGVTQAFFANVTSLDDVLSLAPKDIPFVGEFRNEAEEVFKVASNGFNVAAWPLRSDLKTLLPPTGQHENCLNYGEFVTTYITAQEMISCVSPLEQTVPVQAVAPLPDNAPLRHGIALIARTILAA